MAVAHGRNDQRSGQIYSFGYQLSRLGRLWSDSHQFNFSIDYRDEDYQASRFSILNTLSSQYRIQYSLPITDFLSTSIGLSLAKLRQSLEDRRSIDLGFNLRISNGINLSAFGSRAYDEFKNINDQLYAFVTFSFPDYGQYVQGAYNSNDQSYRLSVNNDQQNRLNTFRTQANLETNQNYDEARGDILFNGSYAEVGIRAQTRKNELESSHLNRTQLRMATSIVIVADQGNLKAEFTRPITQSFALFHLENSNGEPLSLRGSGLHEEASRGPFGHSVFTNLLPYQQRAVQVDSLQLAAGKSFSKEYFILNPTYRSGHLVTLSVASEKVIKGTLSNEQNQSLSLRSGELTEVSSGETITFFTNRLGEFFIEGIQAGDYSLRIDRLEINIFLKNLSDSDEIVHDLGSLVLSAKERL
jgi:outer membrane usher protein